MKFITRILQQKYQIFNNILFEERKELFCSHTYCRNNANYDYLLEMVLGREAIDPDSNIILVRFDYNKFEEYREFVMFMQYSMMKIFNNYNQYQNKTMKRFNKQKIILKREAYRTILLKYFCQDLAYCIVEFLI